jgi:CheY-like chemotaxis protein
MGIPLRILIIEDSECDAVLVVRALQKGGYDPSYVRMETADAMSEAFIGESWDGIISDYCMPVFSGSGALALCREKGLDIPFVIVSGAIGEEAAAAAMVSRRS